MPEDEVQAQSDCERFVRQRLGPQSTTAFSPLHASSISRGDEGLWSVAGDIATHEGTVARRKGSYHCTLRYVRRAALLQSLHID